MDKLITEVTKSLTQNFNTDVSITVALSGGVDSVALLHILHTIVINNLTSIKINLDAIHINHGISANAEGWTDFCKEFCKNLNINLTVAHHTISKSGGESLENNARKIRYREFYQHPCEIIVLAHHKIDQVETTLTQIFRGSDLHNIAAMRPITEKQNKIFWRPLLNLTKNDLEEYVERHNLVHIVDDSNSNNQYLRNFIRNKIIPDLNTWDNHIGNKILQITTQIQETLALTDEIAANDLLTCQVAGMDLDLDKFKLFSQLRQNNLISYFILWHKEPLPSKRQISEFVRQLNTCKEDKSPRLQIASSSEIILQNKVIQIKNYS